MRVFWIKAPQRCAWQKKNKKTSQLKGNQCENARWPEKVENVQKHLKDSKECYLFWQKRQHAHFSGLSPFFRLQKKEVGTNTNTYTTVKLWRKKMRCRMYSSAFGSAVLQCCFGAQSFGRNGKCKNTSVCVLGLLIRWISI